MTGSEAEMYGPFALETTELSKHFGAVKAVDRLTISIPKAGMTSIVGPNGSGKSTLVNLLSGMLPIDGGMVILDSLGLKVVKAHDTPSHGLTRTFQDIRLFEQITVWDNLMVVLTTRSWFPALMERDKPSYKKKTEEILKSVGLWEKRRDLALNLSYGQRKLLEIGRALAMDVRILLFDEPFAGLFPQMLEQVKSILKDLKVQGRTIIFISHNMDIVRELSDRIYVLDSGELLAEGDVEEVLSSAKVIEAYLGV